MRTKITIICPTHGNFIQCPKEHLNQKQGCPLCGNKKKNEHRQLSTSDFIKSATKIHQNKYDYTKVCYVNHSTKIIIICKVHGAFLQWPGGHLQGQRCPKCAKAGTSKVEHEWLDKIGIPTKNRQKYLRLNNRKYIVDGYDPETGTIYEFFGDFWHGNPKIYNPSDINPVCKKTFGTLYETTMNKIQIYQDLGYNIVYIWESDYNVR